MIIGEHSIGSPPGIGDSYLSNIVSYQIDEISILNGVEVIEGGFRYSLNRLSGIYLLTHLTSTYESLIAIGKASVPCSYIVSTGLLNPIISFSVDCALRPSYESTIPSTSVLDALVWSYADMFDAIWRQMETMSNALKLEYALGTDLDDAWGQIYDLPRIINEDDTSYRDRLKTRTTILNSSGTKSNCEIIIDSIIGLESTTITTRYPSSVDIRFSSENAIRIAKEKLSTLSILLPQMIAHGVSYNLFLPLVDYEVTSVMKGTNSIEYSNYFAIGYFDVDLPYTIVSNISHQYLFPYDMKVVSKKSLYKYYRSDVLVAHRDNIKTYINDLVTKGLKTKTFNIYNIIKKYNINKTFIVDQFIKKYDINKNYLLDSDVLKSNPRRYATSLILV